MSVSSKGYVTLRFRKMSFDTATQIRSIAMEAHRVPQEFSIDIPARLKELGFEVRTEDNGGYVYAKRNKPYPST